MSRLTRLHERLRAELCEPAELYLALTVGAVVVGRVRRDLAEALRHWPRYLEVSGERVSVRSDLDTHERLTRAFDEIARGLSSAGLLTAWRGERYRVATRFAAPPIFELERAAARFFGIRTWAVHVNGVVEEAGSPRMWIARRSLDKAIDPGRLDNLVGGGIRAGSTVRETVIREAWEEAGIDARLATQSMPAGLIAVRHARREGLHVQAIFVHDLFVPATFRPACQDGEVAEHRLCTLEETMELMCRPGEMTLDATLVAVDHLVRHGVFSPDEEGYCELVSLLRNGA